MFKSVIDYSIVGRWHCVFG